MSKNIPINLLSNEESIENALHLFVTSGEDGEIDYFLDTEAEYSDDYSIIFPYNADSFIHNALESVESSTGIKFTESTFDDADWVIDMTNDYDDSGVSSEDWGSWSTIFKDPEDGSDLVLNKWDTSRALLQIGYTLGLNTLPESTSNLYTLSDSVMSYGWKGSHRQFTLNDTNALRSIWGEFIDLPDASSNSQTSESSSDPSAELDSSQPIEIPSPSSDSSDGTTTINNITNITNTGSGFINTGNTGAINIDNSFVLQTINITLSEAITGESRKKERVEGTDGNDLIADGQGKDKLIGGDGADQFYFAGDEPFKKNTADKVIDFDSSEGDSLVIADEILADMKGDPTLAIADTKKELKILSREDYDLIYFEPKGDLFLDGNGDSRGFGNKEEGGLIADLANNTNLSDSDVLIGV
ncbi:calcium-binding protein [Synechococcus sp. AH-601-P18]|nr:calcium-binding protein [Synechococcus sp. AH-601-P18]